MNDIWQKVLLAGIVIVVAAAVRIGSRFVIRRTVHVLTARQEAQDVENGSRARRLLDRAVLANERQKQRIATLGSLLRNVVDVVLVVITLLTVLATFGVPMGPLIASAGIGGVALGFGAQSLVKDYLSGIFMLTEDQFGVGDLVRIGDLSGTVQEVSLRVTKLRDPGGTIWYVRNGEVLTLGNISQGFSSETIDVPVAIDEDPDRVTSVLRAALAGMADEPDWGDTLLEQPTVLGISSMSGGTMTVQISLKTEPNKQWGPARAIRERAQRALVDAGIRGPILPGAPKADG